MLRSVLAGIIISESENPRTALGGGVAPCSKMFMIMPLVASRTRNPKRWQPIRSNTIGCTGAPRVRRVVAGKIAS
jgi:hypothetical protein